MTENRKLIIVCSCVIVIGIIAILLCMSNVKQTRQQIEENKKIARDYQTPEEKIAKEEKRIREAKEVELNRLAQIKREEKRKKATRQKEILRNREFIKPLTLVEKILLAEKANVFIKSNSNIPLDVRYGYWNKVTVKRQGYYYNVSCKVESQNDDGYTVNNTWSVVLKESGTEYEIVSYNVR